MDAEARPLAVAGSVARPGLYERRLRLDIRGGEPEQRSTGKEGRGHRPKRYPSHVGDHDADPVESPCAASYRSLCSAIALALAASASGDASYSSWRRIQSLAGPCG
jgi:hypothetical protein